MDRAIITIHLPSHRRAMLQQQSPTHTATDAYDRNIGRYIKYLQEQGARDGFRVATDYRDLNPVYSIDERDHQQKKAAHDWIERVPDLWEWIT